MRGRCTKEARSGGSNSLKRGSTWTSKRDSDSCTHSCFCPEKSCDAEIKRFRRMNMPERTHRHAGTGRRGYDCNYYCQCVDSENYADCGTIRYCACHKMTDERQIRRQRKPKRQAVNSRATDCSPIYGSSMESLMSKPYSRSRSVLRSKSNLQTDDDKTENQPVPASPSTAPSNGSVSTKKPQSPDKRSKSPTTPEIKPLLKSECDNSGGAELRKRPTTSSESPPKKKRRTTRTKRKICLCSESKVPRRTARRQQSNKICRTSTRRRKVNRRPPVRKKSTMSFLVCEIAKYIPQSWRNAVPAKKKPKAQRLHLKKTKTRKRQSRNCRTNKSRINQAKQRGRRLTESHEGCRKKLCTQCATIRNYRLTKSVRDSIAKVLESL